MSDTNAHLMMDAKGVLSIQQQQAGQLPIPPNANSATVKSVATLEDSGDFVVYELNDNGSVNGVPGQPFDHPTDTLLPRRGGARNFQSWGRIYKWVRRHSPQIFFSDSTI